MSGVGKVSAEQTDVFVHRPRLAGHRLVLAMKVLLGTAVYVRGGTGLWEPTAEQRRDGRQDRPRNRSLRAAVYMRDRTLKLLPSGGSRIKRIFVGRRPVLPMAVVTVDLPYGGKPRMAEIPRLGLIAGIVRWGHCILGVSSNGRRMVSFLGHRKPRFRGGLHEASVAVVSTLELASFCLISLSVRGQNSSLEHHPRRSQAAPCFPGSRWLATSSPSWNSSLDDDPLLLDSLWRLGLALDGTESPLPKTRQHVPVHGRSIDGVSAITLEAATNAAAVADGKLADAALLQRAATLLVAEVAFGRGHVGCIPSVVSGVEAREERPGKQRKNVGWLRGCASGGLVLLVRGAGRALFVVVGAEGSGAGRDGV